MLKSKLLPCPFCGGKRARLMTDQDPNPYSQPEWVMYYIRCSRTTCLARGPAFTRYAMFPNNQPELAAAAWNNRISTDAPR